VSQSSVRVEVEGLDAVISRLERLEGSTDEIAQKGVNAAGRMLAREIRLRTPVRTGALVSSIGTKKLKRSEMPPGSSVGVVAGPVRKAWEIVKGRPKKRSQFYKAYWLENTGAGRHRIPEEGTTPMKFDGGVFHKVLHPGFRPRPFIGPAQDVVFPQLEKIYAKELDRVLDKIYGAG